MAVTPAAPWHSILDIQFSNTNPWKDDRRNLILKAVLGIPDTKLVSMQVDIQNGSNVRRTLLDQTDFLADTVRTYSVLAKELVLGKNTLFLTFQDEYPPIDSTGKIEFQYDVIMEDRENLKIARRFAFEEEYLVSGPLTIDPVDGLKLVTEAGLEEGIVVPKNAIQMDGRAKIKKITVVGDPDKLGDASSKCTAIYRADRGDSILQRLPLSDLRTFKAIAKIEVVDN